MLVVLTLHNEFGTKCERVCRPTTTDHLADLHDNSTARGFVLITFATLSTPRRSVLSVRRTLRPNPVRFACRVCRFRAPSARNNHAVVKQLTMSAIAVNSLMPFPAMAFRERVYWDTCKNFITVDIIFLIRNLL